MTDKPIMIDGVDVSGCKKYEHEIVRCNATLRNMCFCGGRCTDKKNEDCYFKQLKHKEQKNEEIKKTLAEIKFWVRELLKRTGQVVPYEIKQILQEINECEVKND